MSITEEYKKALKAEENKIKKNTSFAETIQKIDELKATGILTKKTYGLPLADTLGRHLSSGRRSANKS